MDIHTTLTLVVAAAILVAAMLIGFVVTNVVRLVTFLWRVIVQPAQPRRRIEDALPRTPLHARVFQGAKASVVFVAASIAEAGRWLGRSVEELLTVVEPASVPSDQRDADRAALGNEARRS